MRMTTSIMHLLIDCQNTLGECVLWCERTGRLLWTDIEGASLWCHTLATGWTTQYQMPERLASFALTNDDDRLLLGLASQLAFYRFSNGQLAPICAIEPHLTTTRVNDGRCDRQGRFVFGTINQARGHEPIAGFYRLNCDLSLDRLALEPVGIANSICFSVDGSLMYHADSTSKKIRCCDYDPMTGSVSNARIFVDLGTAPGVPDGSTVDASGYVWNAQWGGARIVRYAPDGTIDRIMGLPVSQPSCITFGGASLDDLFVTSARADLSESALVRETGAGGIFTTRISDVKGLPEQRFQGA